VIAIMGAGKTPIPVDPGEIAAIRTVVQSGLAAQPWPYPRVGETVSIARGPLRGIDGILIDVNRKQRLVLSVALLRRSVAVEVDRDWVFPVGISPAAR
jgi:transcription antitermination factor NusG